MRHERRAAITTAGVVSLLLLAACQGTTAAPPGPPTASPAAAEVAWPATFTPTVDQSRFERAGRTVYVRIGNGGDAPAVLTRLELSSARFDPVTWSGEEPFDVGQLAHVELDLPPGHCAADPDVVVRATYRVGDGPEQVSSTVADDVYGAVGLLLDRDCAERSLTDAATVTVGEPRLLGRGRGSRLRIPLDVVATGADPGVAFAGVADTVLFRLLAGSPRHDVDRPVPMTPGARVRTALLVVPARCDPHALAEDKVGTLFPVHVTGPGLPDGAAYYLPIPDGTRAALRGMIGPYCGWPS